MSDTWHIVRLFDSAADRYAQHIAPLLEPLADNFVAFAKPQPADLVLDVGTGTGLVARLVAPAVRMVVGLDLSTTMLTRARDTVTGPELALVRGDLHHAPFALHGFDLILAAFGLNATRPAPSLRALRDLIPPGGRLAIQEWGPVTALDEILDRLLANYATDAPDFDLATFRAWASDDAMRWQNQLQDVDDYREWLANFGFTVDTVEESAPVTVRVPSVDAYLSFWSAWPDRALELAALDTETRAKLMDQARAQLAAFAAPDGSLFWQPDVLRVLARR